MKKLVFLCLCLLQCLNVSAQSTWQPDTVLSIYGESFLFTEQFFEFSDKSKVISLLARDSISTNFNDTTLNLRASYLDYVQATLLIDSNLQVTKAVGMPWSSPFEAGDSIYTIISAGWNDTLDINPGGNPVFISSNGNVNKSYLCVYDKELVLARHHLVNQNNFSSGKVVFVEPGKIVVAISERDPNINGSNLGTGRQHVLVLNQSGSILTDKVILERYGTYWSYTMLDWIVPSDAGGYYAYLDGASPGDQIDLNLGTGGTQVQTVAGGDDTWLAKLDQNFNFIWGITIAHQSNSVLKADLLFESGTSDSLLLTGYGGSPGLTYQPIGGTVSNLAGNLSAENKRFRLKISKSSGQLGSYNLGYQAAAYQQGNMLLRFAKNFKTFSGQIQQEYLNIQDNTFPVPDSQTVLAIYTDPTMGIPSAYRILGAHGIHQNSNAHKMRMSDDGSQIHVTGFQRGDFRLDTAYNSLLPDLNAGATLFFAKFQKSALATELDDVQELLSFRAYPNPCTDYIRIEMEGILAQEVQLLDMHGRLLQAWKWNGQVPLQVDLSQFPASAYFIQVEAPNGDKIGKRIIKQ